MFLLWNKFIGWFYGSIVKDILQEQTYELENILGFESKDHNSKAHQIPSWIK
jgi:hypothetical protein